MSAPLANYGKLLQRMPSGGKSNAVSLESRGWWGGTVRSVVGACKVKSIIYLCCFLFSFCIDAAVGISFIFCRYDTHAHPVAVKLMNGIEPRKSVGMWLLVIASMR